METIQQNNRRIAKNTSFLYIRMLFVLVINLYISRALLDNLGVSDYGTYVVVAGFVTMFGFFNATLSSTMQRYYNYIGTKGKQEGLKNVFSTGIYIHLTIAFIIVLALETFGVWYCYNVLVIPANRLNAALLVFHASVISLFFLILQSPFTGIILSQERMNWYAIVSIIDIVLKLAATISLSYLPTDSLSTYAIFLTLISIVDLLLYASYAKLHWHFLSLSHKIDKKLIKSLLSFTGWNLIGTFAFMLRGQGISLLLNNFFGTIVNAARGIAMQVSSAIQNFSSNISIAFAPQIVNAVASENKERAERLMFIESKICYALLLIIAIPLCLEIDFVLSLWLGKNIPIQTNIFSILMLIDAVICTLNTPCTQIAQSTGRIKNYQIGSSIVNLCLIPVCYIFLWIGFSAISSFVVTILFSIINQIVCCYFSHHVFPFSIKSYFTMVLCPCALLTLVLPIGPYLTKIAMTPSVLRVILEIAVDIVLTIPCVYWLLLNSPERYFVMNTLKNKLYK